jgi:hypothetical protein
MLEMGVGGVGCFFIDLAGKPNVKPTDVTLVALEVFAGMAERFATASQAISLY